MLRLNRATTTLSGLVCALGLLAGCGGGSTGPDVAPVTGVVKLDGAPLADARIEFLPATGRPSYGFTNDQGVYELTYTEQQQGAIVGSDYTVKITTGKEAISSEGKKIQDAVKEKLPAKYHSKSELKAKVEAKSNQIDFDLTSGK